MIKVENLNEAYNQTNELFDTEVNDGTELLSQMEKLIINLKEHWKGNDGIRHINRLIYDYEKFQSFLDVTIESTRNAMAGVVTLQTARKANGGGDQIGELKESFTAFFNKIEYAQVTEKYYIDPEIVNDYKLLEEVEEKIQYFDRKISTLKEHLMDNWILGYNRQEVMSYFDDIETLGEQAEKDITDMKVDLSSSISNANLIMDN